MKPFFLASLLALGASACVDNPPALQLFQATVPDAQCAIEDDPAGLLAGSLNLDLSLTYQLGFIVNANVANTEVVVGDTPVSEAENNAIYVTEVDFSYETTPNLNIPSATVPIYGVFRGGTENNQLVISMLTAQAVQALLAATAGGTAVEVRITMQLKGKTGVGAGVESNEVTFPLTVFDVPFTCPGTRVPEPATGPCDPRGQNGAVPACINPPQG